MGISAFSSANCSGLQLIPSLPSELCSSETSVGPNWLLSTHALSIPSFGSIFKVTHFYRKEEQEVIEQALA